MNSQLTLPRLHAVAIMATFAAGLPVGCNASSRADEHADALDKAIPPAMQRASVPGAIVGIWQDGREPYVRAFSDGPGSALRLHACSRLPVCRSRTT
jgi:D-alanyl-D-alanine carboxypeptidase